MENFSIEVLAKEIAMRSELAFTDIIEELYLKLTRYQVPMYRDVMISLYFLKKSANQVISYYDLPNEATVGYIIESVTNGLVHSFVEDYNDEDDSE